MAKSKKNYVVIALVVALLSLSLGYAAFSQNLTINGTATGTANWDVKFTSATMSDASHGSATVDADDTVTVAGLMSYPGDGFTVTTEITNNGSVDAKLTSFELVSDDGTPFSNDDIDVSIPSIQNDSLKAGDVCPVTIAVKWKETSEVENVNANFKVKFTYEQDTTAVDVSPAHGTH